MIGDKSFRLRILLNRDQIPKYHIHNHLIIHVINVSNFSYNKLYMIGTPLTLKGTIPRSILSEETFKRFTTKV